MNGSIGTSLLGLYWRNLISTPLAFLMVLALNLFTPLGFFDEVREILVTKGAWKLLLLVLLSLLAVAGTLQYLVQRPLAQAIKNLCSGNQIQQPLSEKAERRLLKFAVYPGVDQSCDGTFPACFHIRLLLLFHGVTCQTGCLHILSYYHCRNGVVDSLLFPGGGVFKEKHNCTILSPMETLSAGGIHTNVHPLTDSGIVHWGYCNPDDHRLEHSIACLVGFGLHQCFPYEIQSRSLGFYRGIVWDFHCLRI